MSAITAAKASSILPDRIILTSDETLDQRTSLCWQFFGKPLAWIGRVLRDAFYLRLYSSKNQDDVLNERMASETLGGSKLSRRDIKIISKEVGITRIYTVRIIECTSQIGKKLRIILFSFYGNQERIGKISQKWNPRDPRELQNGPLSVLRACKKLKLRVDSIITTSLGNILWQGGVPEDLVPETVIVNRGFTSTRKVIKKLSCLERIILPALAWLTGWQIDAEAGLKSLETRLVIIEAKMDSYFSGAGGFGKMANAHVRATFFPTYFHVRAHHALSLDHLKRNSLTTITGEDAFFREGESAATAIARNVFSSGWHTCVYVCGNDAQLNLGTARGVLPLISAFITQDEKKETSSTKHYE